MSFAQASPAHFALSASIARRDTWLPDAIHCRLDTSEILGFAQTPAFISWAPLDDMRPGAFSTEMANPAWQIKRGLGSLSVPMAATPASNLSLTLAPGVPHVFRVSAKGIAQAEVSVSGFVSVYGIIETPGGPIRVPAKRLGFKHILAGRRFDHLLIVAERPSRLIRITGIPEDSIFEPKVRIGLFRRKFLNHALTLDAMFQKFKRLDASSRQQISSNPAARAAIQRALGLVKNAISAAPMPPLAGALPDPGSPEAQLLHASAQSKFNIALNSLTDLLDGPMPQRRQISNSGPQSGTSASVAETVLLHELMLVVEDLFGGTLFGRRLGLSFPGGEAGAVLVSARAIWSVTQEDISRVGALAPFIIPDRNALRTAMAVEPFDPAGQVLDLYVPDNAPGPFLPLEARVLVDTTQADDLPTAPEAVARDVPHPFNTGRDTRRAAFSAITRPGAALVLDRGQTNPLTRINPVMIKAQDLGRGRTLPERHGLIFGMTDPDPPHPPAWGLSAVHLSDREAPVADTAYRLSQGDGFGRWSSFARFVAPGPARPLPSKPTLLVDWRLSLAQDGSGTLFIEVAAPHQGLIAPGGLPIAHLDLLIPIADAPSDRDEIAIENLPLSGEGLEPIRREISLPAPPVLGMLREARVEACYRDTEDRPGPSAVARKQMPDPTPPPAPHPLPRLTALSFPDPNGVSRAEAEVSGLHSAVASLRIFTATEASLRGGLLRLNDPVISAEVDAAQAEPDLAARAAMIEAMMDDLPSDVWAPAGSVAVTSGRAQISQPVNGLPRDLVSLKITSVTGAGVESRDSVIAFFGLPVQKPLSPPLIEARMLDLTQFELLIPRPAGPVPDEIRLMRSADSDEPGRMLPSMLVMAGPTAKWPIRVVDAGETLLGPKARLRSFVQYRWRAQARLGPRFAGAAPSVWTYVGPVARAMLAPPTRPAPPTVTASPDPDVTGGVRLDFTDLAQTSLTLEIVELPASNDPILIPVTSVEMSVLLPAHATRTGLQIKLRDPLERPSDVVLIKLEASP